MSGVWEGEGRGVFLSEFPAASRTIDNVRSPWSMINGNPKVDPRDPINQKFKLEHSTLLSPNPLTSNNR